MPARVCAYIEAVYTLFCDTLTKRSNNKHRDYPLPPQTTPALLHCKQGRVGGNYSCEPKARMSKHVTRAHGWCAFVCRGSDRARRSYWPCQKGGPLMLSLTANGEVPVLWVDGGTVAVMPCSRSIR